MLIVKNKNVNSLKIPQNKIILKCIEHSCCEILSKVQQKFRVIEQVS